MWNYIGIREYHCPHHYAQAHLLEYNGPMTFIFKISNVIGCDVIVFFDDCSHSPRTCWRKFISSGLWEELKMVGPYRRNSP